VTAPAFPRPVQVFEPHRAGLPPLRNYIREFWRRREFSSALSRSTMKAAHSTTVFGRLWLVLNPLLLASVYYLLVTIISGGRNQGEGYFVHLVGGLFAFYFISGCMSNGATSVVGGGKLILNTAFPRLLLPFTAVRTAIARFWPTMVVFAVIYVVSGLQPTWATLMVIPAFLLILMFALGISALFGAIQVYFRDTQSFLPYFTRIWLYASPVLYYIEQVPERLQMIMPINPLYSLLGIWGDVLVRGEMPPTWMWPVALGWALLMFIGGTLFFMSREREFAVRL
jgi:teichoic acid transport system permease protein